MPVFYFRFETEWSAWAKEAKPMTEAAQLMTEAFGGLATANPPPLHKPTPLAGARHSKADKERLANIHQHAGEIQGS